MTDKKTSVADGGSKKPKKTAKTQNKNLNKTEDNGFEAVLKDEEINIPCVGDVVSGKILSIEKSQIKIDINGEFVGVVRGPQLYYEASEYSQLKPGDEVTATIMEEENENGELELSFRTAGQEKAWNDLKSAHDSKEIIKVRINGANKGGLIASFRQISGFIPVSQLSPENYPRVSGGDKNKILEKLKTFVGKELDAIVTGLGPTSDKIIFSEKDAWTEQQKDTLSLYKIGTIVDGTVSAIADFGVFINFGENLEGLIHISELAWQRIDDPGDIFKVGDKIKAEIISVDGAKIFLSAKKLLQDPWSEVEKKYKIGQVVTGKIIKINPFGLFVELDPEIHGLAHMSHLGLAQGAKPEESFAINDEKEFTILSIQPKEHRLGLAVGKVKLKKEEPNKENKKNESEKIKGAEKTEESKIE